MVDGLQRSTHLLPIHIQGEYNHSIRAIATRNQTRPVNPMTILLCLCPILQSAQSPDPSPTDLPSSAVLAVPRPQPRADSRRSVFSTDEAVLSDQASEEIANAAHYVLRPRPTPAPAPSRSTPTQDRRDSHKQDGSGSR
jgi:hypothetical protein